MALTIKVGDQVDDQEEAEEVPPTHEPIPVRLNIKKTVDGNLLIFDHPDVDFSIVPEKSKITVFPKERISDKVYDIQDRLFKNLFDNGVIKQDSIQGGAVYGSMEATYPESEEVNVLETVVLVIGKFIEEERKFIDIDKEVEEEWEDNLIDPDKDDSTELGEIPQHTQKGSVRPGYIYSPYGISSIYRYE